MYISFITKINYMEKIAFNYLLIAVSILFLVSPSLAQKKEGKTKCITNPILPGFNPDPSILRVGNEYFIATSTFQWFPGVSVYHSYDLTNWEHYTNILTRKSQLDMTGIPNSGGIYAPQISYIDSTFYLVYTNVKGNGWPYMDCENYVVWAKDMKGPWSEPVYLNSAGFDPSLFHDKDGKSYLLFNEINFRDGVNDRAYIYMHEFNRKTKNLFGDVKLVLKEFAEGPHIYRHGDFYYLLVAEGGTDYNHREDLFRSKSIWGPYETNPNNPIITSKDNPSLTLQKAGHCSLVETQYGEWYMPHLVGRPILPEKKCPLGRETAIQKIEWTEDGWFKLVGDNHWPKDSIKAPKNLVQKPFKIVPSKDDFSDTILRKEYFTLREPAEDSWLSLKARPGFLRMKGRLHLFSSREQSLLVRRIQHFNFRAETAVDFNPKTYREMAGLIVIYDSRNFFYLRISRDSINRKSLNILHMKGSGAWDCKEDLLDDIVLPEDKTIHLKVECIANKIQFYYSTGNLVWNPIGSVFNFTELSDENNYGFTGSMVGIAVQDMMYKKTTADFDYFEYKGIDK